jgi:putative transcription factor
MADLYCDICGKAPVRAQILIEGAKLLACGSCVGSGKVLHRFTDEEANATGASASGNYTVIEASEEIIEDFARIFRVARERTGLPLAVIAERTREKESFLHALEGGRLTPTLDVAKKLEKELGVKLVEKVSATVAPSAAGSKAFTPPTLADMVDLSKGKKKKKG